MEADAQRTSPHRGKALVKALILLGFILWYLKATRALEGVEK